MRVRTEYDGAITRHSFFTKENRFQGLAEESLTLSPYLVRCPLSTAPLAPTGIHVPAREHEFVVGGESCERGT